MPNIAAIYSEATGQAALTRKRLEESANKNPVASPAEEATLLQSKLDWLANPETVKFFKALKEEVTALETNAEDLALAYPQHNNHQLIIQKLVIAGTLRKVMNKHASNK